MLTFLLGSLVPVRPGVLVASGASRKAGGIVECNIEHMACVLWLLGVLSGDLISRGLWEGAYLVPDRPLGKQSWGQEKKSKSDSFFSW